MWLSWNKYKPTRAYEPCDFASPTNENVDNILTDSTPSVCILQYIDTVCSKAYRTFPIVYYNNTICFVKIIISKYFFFPLGRGTMRTTLCACIQIPTQYNIIFKLSNYRILSILKIWRIWLQYRTNSACY